MEGIDDTAREGIAARVRLVGERIAEALARSGRSGEEVTVVAATKTVPVAALLAAYAAGLRVFGENRVQEAKAKAPQLPSDVEWHLIGPLQTNKARDAVALFGVIETVDRLPLVERLVRLRERTGGLPRLFVEVNVGRETQKAGVLPEDLPGFLAAAAERGIRPEGLMAVPPLAAAPEEARPYFRQLRRLRDALRPTFPNLRHLSMGMSRDFEVAVEEGATVVRIGTFLFGARDTGRR